MNVADLIARLQTMPQDAEVELVYDGGARADAVHVWLSRSGSVLLADRDEPVYDDSDRPIGAPSKGADPYWKTPSC